MMYCLRYLSVFVMCCSAVLSSASECPGADLTGEKLTYSISPLGTAEYVDQGLTDLQGKPAKLITFRTMVFGFDDLEKIYVDQQTSLPLRVERYISWPFSKEYIVEEYSSETRSLRIKKFVNKVAVDEQLFTAKGPIHNAIFLPFSLRDKAELAVGSTFDVRLPEEFKVTLVSIDDLNLPSGAFKAYHFVSAPHKFEIWISQDAYRIPLVIKGTGGLGYSMQMQRYFLNGKVIYERKDDPPESASSE